MAANVDKRSFKQGCLFFLEPFQRATGFVKQRSFTAKTCLLCKVSEFTLHICVIIALFE